MRRRRSARCWPKAGTVFAVLAAATVLALVNPSPVTATAPHGKEHGEKVVSILPDGTIVTSQGGKVVDVDRKAISADQGATAPARPKNPPATVRATRPPAAPSTPSAGTGTAPSAVPSGPRSLRSSVVTTETAEPPRSGKGSLFLAFMCVAVVLFFVSYVFLLAGAFSQSILWGAALLVFPVVGGLVFAFCHWEKARVAAQVFAFAVLPPFLVSLFLLWSR